MQLSAGSQRIKEDWETEQHINESEWRPEIDWGFYGQWLINLRGQLATGE